MDEAEREIWCRAWRLLLQRGDGTLALIDAEMAAALHCGDAEEVARWRQIADAVGSLAR